LRRYYSICPSLSICAPRKKMITAPPTKPQDTEGDVTLSIVIHQILVPFKIPLVFVWE
jgi:hypothetical protein